MDTLGFIERMTSSLAWPLALVAIIAFLRNEIRGLIGQITKLKFKDFEIAVAKDFSKTQSENTKAMVELPSIESDPQAGRYAALAEIAPKTVVVECWKRIEKAISQILLDRELELSDEDFAKPLRLIDKLLGEGLTDAWTFSIIKNMYLLRNKVVHYEGLVVTSGDAKVYYQNTLKVMGMLNKIDPSLRLA
jgi:hypothetical protein